jgi:hypothetical protein
MKTTQFLPGRKFLPGRMRFGGFRESILNPFLAGFLICTLVMFSQGCNYYKVTQPKNPSPSTLDNYSDKGKIFYVVSGGKAFSLDGFQMQQDAVTGYALPQPDYKYHLTTKPTGANRYHQKTDGAKARILKHVLLYVSDFEPETNSIVQIPFEDIEKIELYDEDTGATVASWLLGGVVVLGLSTVLMTVVIAAMKGSCPFIYVFDGEQYAFSGEIFSGATLPQLERHDYLKLPPHNKFADEFRMIITNEVREIQYTNQLELLVCDHPPGVEIHADKYGRVHSLQEIMPPLSAVNFAGEDLLALVSGRDDLVYVGLEQGGTEELTDGLILEFPNPGMASEARLVIRAKNSILLDYHMGRFHDLFGRAYSRWHKKQLATPAHELQQWITDQNIPFSVFIEKDGQWEYVDHYNVVGPMALKEDVLSIPLGQAVSGSTPMGQPGNETGPMGQPGEQPLRVKLEFGRYFWEVDFAGIDYQPDAQTITRNIPATSAVDHTGTDISHLVAGDDDLYYIQPEVGDEATLSFPLPPLEGEDRSLILHSKGHYHILREPTGRPQVRSLRTFRESGQFNRFTNEFMLSF